MAAEAGRERVPDGGRGLVVFAIKAVHSLIFFVLQSTICYLFYKGVRGEPDRRAAVAAVVVGAECAVYAGNRFRCPLTGLAEKYGAERGSVTDIFLPGWLARNIANFYAPLYAYALMLLGFSLWQRRSRPRQR